MQNFPKSLLGFYIKYAAKPFIWLISAWIILFWGMYIVEGLSWPLVQKTFISLFEQTVPAGETFISFAMPVVITIVVIYLIIDGMELLQSIMSNRWRPKVQNRINEILHDYTHDQSMEFWTNRIVGKVNSQINYVSGGFNILFEITMMLGAVSVIGLNMFLIMSINKYVAFVLGGAFVFRLVYGLLRINPMLKASKTASEASSYLSGKVIDSLSNFSIVKLFAGIKYERKHLDQPRQKNIKDRIYAGMMQRWFWAVPMVVNDILFGVMLALCIYLFSLGDMKISEIVFTMSVHNVVMGSIGNLVRQIPNITDVVGSAQQSYKELIKPIKVVDIPNAQDLKVSKGEIEIRGVTFFYNDEQSNKNDKGEEANDKKSKTLVRRKKRKVLDGLSLKIKPGEKVGLVGSSGAGKTTLVHLLTRFYDPSTGGIYIDGQNICKVTQNSLRKNIAFIPQEPTMFNRTLRDNIGYSKLYATDKEIEQAAKHAEADKFIQDAPKKYDSMVGDRGIKLSGGQRQRIAIARAFLKDAPILILDEATSALDSETENAIQKSFAELSNGRTTIAIAHRLSTLRNMDRIVVLDKGKIVESGTHNTLVRKKNGRYAKLWKMQSGGFIQE